MEFQQGFNNGCQQTLRSHMKIGMTLLAPLPPLGSDDSYQSGFACGTARAEADINSGALN